MIGRLVFLSRKEARFALEGREPPETALTIVIYWLTYKWLKMFSAWCWRLGKTVYCTSSEGFAMLGFLRNIES